MKLWSFLGSTEWTPSSAVAYLQDLTFQDSSSIAKNTLHRPAPRTPLEQGERTTPFMQFLSQGPFQQSGSQFEAFFTSSCSCLFLFKYQNYYFREFCSVIELVWLGYCLYLVNGTCVDCCW